MIKNYFSSTKLNILGWIEQVDKESWYTWRLYEEEKCEICSDPPPRSQFIMIGKIPMSSIFSSMIFCPSITKLMLDCLLYDLWVIGGWNQREWQSSVGDEHFSMWVTEVILTVNLSLDIHHLHGLMFKTLQYHENFVIHILDGRGPHAYN